MTERMPNVVLIMADQHRADLMGCAGQPAVQTPNLDRLAAEGVRFTRTTCQGPLCMPARASFLSRALRARPRRLHELGGAPARHPDLPPRVAGRGLPHRAAREGPSLPRQHASRSARRRARPAPRTAGIRGGPRDRRQVRPHVSPTATPTISRDRGSSTRTARHLADRSYQGDQESGREATKRVPMWDATPSPVPLADYIDTWHGDARRRAGSRATTDAEQPFFCFVGFPGPHDPWDAPQPRGRALPRADSDPAGSTRRPVLDGLGDYGIARPGDASTSPTPPP